MLCGTELLCRYPSSTSAERVHAGAVLGLLADFLLALPVAPPQGQPAGDLGHALPEGFRLCFFLVGGRTISLGSGNRRNAVGCRPVFEDRLLLAGSDNDHAEPHQHGQNRMQRLLVTPVGRTRGGEGCPHLVEEAVVPPRSRSVRGWRGARR